MVLSCGLRVTCHTNQSRKWQSFAIQVFCPRTTSFMASTHNSPNTQSSSKAFPLHLSWLTLLIIQCFIYSGWAGVILTLHSYLKLSFVILSINKLTYAHRQRTNCRIFQERIFRQFALALEMLLLSLINELIHLCILNFLLNLFFI